MATFAAFRQSITARLTLLVAVVAAPLFGLQIHNTIDEADAARREALDRSLRVARSVLGRVDDHLHNVDALLVAVAAAVPPRRDAVDAGNATLRKIKSGLPGYFGSISVIEPDGTMLYSAETPPPKPGSINVADRRYFKDAVSSGALAVGDVIVSRTSGKRILVFARPIRDDAASPLRGVVSTSTLLDRFQEIFSEIELPQGSIITILDRKGVVLARSVEPEKWVGTDLSGVQSVRESLDEREGVRELVSADGTPRLSAFTTSRLVPWLIYVGIPSETAFASSQKRRQQGIALTLLVSLLAIGAAVWISRGIARPLRRLAGDAGELARGNLSHRAALVARGEVGELAAGFNVMAASLEAQRAQLQEREARIRSLFEQAADGIFIITPDHRYLDANTEGLRMLGYSREELLGMHVWDVLAEHERPRLAAEVATMMAGTPHLAEWEHLRKDGTTFPAEVSARAHSPDQYLAIVRDQTQRRQAEQALREAHDLYKEMALLAADYVWELDENLRFREITPAPRIKGRFDGASQIGKTRWELPYLGMGEAGWAAHRADLDARRPFRDLELSMRNLQGEERWFLSSGNPVFGPDGRFQGYRGTSVDITELKQSEVRLRDYSNRLEDLSRKLMRVQEDERRALARELHDEVGQALTALKLNLAALRRWFSEEAKLAVLDDCIGLVEDTIGQIRDRSLDLRPPMLDDVGLAGTLQWYASRLAKRAGLTIAADIGALPERPSPEVESAAFRIAQEALTNVLRHAGARKAEIRLETDDRALVLAVRDDGRGFDPAAVRPGETTESGAGLVGMRERVDLLGGEMVIDSSPERGTEIRVRLPLNPQRP